MKTRITAFFFCVLLTAIGSSLTAQHPSKMNAKKTPELFNYSGMWQTISRFEEQSLPKSAQEATEAIYQQALKDKNSPELIKALIHKMKYELVVDKDKFPGLVSEIEKYTADTQDKVEKSMLYSMLAQLYSQYYQSDSYQINQRTAITGYVPEDIREWTGNIFIQKIVDDVRLSLVPEKELQVAEALKYKAILEEGESSRSLRPTLYDFVVNQGIELFSELSGSYQTPSFFKQSRLSSENYFSTAKNFIQIPITSEPNDFTLQALKLYQQLLSFRLQQNNPDALLMADLDRIQLVYNQTENDSREEWYLNALSVLEKQYQQDDICVEILYKKALLMMQPGQGKVIPLVDDFGDLDKVKTKDEGIRDAYQICLEGIRKYPKYERIGLLANLKNQLTQPLVRVSSDNTVYPEKELELTINHKNTSRIVVEIYKIGASVVDYENYWEMKGKYLKSGTLVEKRTIELSNPFPYTEYDTVIKIPMKDLGCYEYVVYSDKKDENQLANHQFSVSRLASISRVCNNSYDFLVTDRISGKPIEGATIKLYEKKGNKNRFVSSVTTDKDGMVTITKDWMITITAGKNQLLSEYNVAFEDDNNLILTRLRWMSSDHTAKDEVARLNLFTDRSIYRPGQTVFFKGIAYTSKEKELTVLQNKSYTIYLKNPEGENITSKTVKTNDFGSFSGEFILPQGLLNGVFAIGEEKYGTSCSFRVEEYKRPGFNLAFSPVKETYRFGDAVHVKGEAQTFSGVKMENTSVKYRVIQRQHWLWRWYYQSNDNQVAEGTVQTNNDGKFEVVFPAEKSFRDKNRKEVYYTYEIQASATDAKGETQESSTMVSVGDKSMYLKFMPIPEKINKEEPDSVSVHAFNLNDQAVDCNGTYQVFSLKAEQSLEKTLDKKDWKQDKLVYSGQFRSKEKLDLLFLIKLQSGKYRILVKANDDQGQPVTEESDFILYSVDDKQPPVVAYEWLVKSKTTCKPGENAEISYGSSAKNVYVLYELFSEGKKIESSRFELNNNIRKLQIPYKESYKQKIFAKLTFIKDSQFFIQDIEISREEPDKTLNLQLDVFRDKLTPGAKEEWKISVKDASKKPIISEILAGMYDASLDRIYDHTWSFYPFLYNYSQPCYSQMGSEFLESGDQFFTMQDYREIPEFYYDAFNWFGLNFYEQTMSLRGSKSKMLQGKMSGISMESKDMASANELTETEPMAASAKPNGYAIDKGEITDALSQQTEGRTEKPIQVRQNFNETAFFYPQLQTNEAGETIISFTVPESNTTWKFMALAHTQDLKFGQMMKEVISQKKLMVSPNLPRFIRQGDKTTIVTNISNLSDQPVKGNVFIEFFDPATNKPLITVDQSTKDFAVEAGKTIQASWTFDVPSGIDLTACKIVAQSETFSDGEQHLLPVLPNRIMVTESLPLHISGKQKKTVNLDHLTNNQSPTLKNYRLTLEWTGNPTWYAVQALPTLTTPESDDVIAWFAAYYSTRLATSIANSTPKIKQVIDTWNKQGGSKETLLSNLEKNQELKAILLEETPWVVEAKSETEQKQRLGLLFDLNRSDNLSASALKKIKEMQLQDGGWGWFKGMYSSPSITQWLLYGMGELSQSNAANYSNEEKEIQKQAVSFIDRKFKENFEYLKKHDTKWKSKSTISTYELEYLLVRSYYNDIPLDETTEAVHFYSEIAEKYWTKGTHLYDRAITVMILNRTGKPQLAKEIVNSLRQHASHNEELGMYWSNNNTHAFLFQSATIIHTFIMQAFEETGATPAEMDEMKRWLLKQKQTQQWESVPATVFSVSALLQTGSDWLSSPGITTVSLGNESVDVNSKEAGTGYFKKVYEAADIRPEMGKVSLAKLDEGPAWGSLYWQYYEDMDKINKAKTNLNVEKKLFVEKVSGSGKVLEPITTDHPLQPGDKVIVRLTVRNDRDMEYVMLKDMRGACFEPAEQLSGTKWKERVVYYQTSKDASTNFYFDNLPKGTYVFEYPLFVTRSGEYSNGITTIQCLYAPEFVSHTKGERVMVK